MRSQWLVSLIAVLIVIVGLASGAFYFSRRSKSQVLEQRLTFIDTLRDEKRYDEALAEIQRLAPQVGSGARRELDRKTMAILMRTGKEENLEKVRQLAVAYLKNHPKDPHLGAVHYALGKIALEKDGNKRAAAERFQTVVSKYPGDPFYPAAELGLAFVDVELGDQAKARARLEALLARDMDRATRTGVEDLLGQLNTEALYSRSLQAGEEWYIIQKGDKPVTIAKKTGVQPELIMRCNGIQDPRTLRVGHRIRIPKVNFSIVVDVGDNTMALLNNGKFFKKYLVRTGKDAGLTPAGAYKIAMKEINPPWSDPHTGKVYKRGDPENELGSRWMGFDRNASLGIHGTIHADTIGQYASNGCVGMLKEDVEELFDLVPVGTEVTIKGERKKQTYAALETSSASTSP